MSTSKGVDEVRKCWWKLQYYMSKSIVIIRMHVSTSRPTRDETLCMTEAVSRQLWERGTWKPCLFKFGGICHSTCVEANCGVVECPSMSR